MTKGVAQQYWQILLCLSSTYRAQNGIFFCTACLQIAYEWANLEDLVKLTSNNRQIECLRMKMWSFVLISNWWGKNANKKFSYSFRLSLYVSGPVLTVIVTNLTQWRYRERAALVVITWYASDIQEKSLWIFVRHLNGKRIHLQNGALLRRVRFSILIYSIVTRRA